MKRPVPQPSPPSIARAAPRKSRKLNPADRAAFIDRYVGARIRERRTMLGVSQQQLAQAIGVTYQQQHKYERGLNRISAGRLFEIAEALAAPVTWFFEAMEAGQPSSELSNRQRMCLELARNFAAIDNQKQQEALSQMARSLVPEGEPDADRLPNADGHPDPAIRALPEAG